MMATLNGMDQDYATIPRIDTWYLKDPVIVDRLREGTDLYLKENLGSVSSSCVLWEAFMAVLHGQAQTLIGSRKKEKKLQMEVLENEVGALEAQLPGNRSEELRW
ncbi:hypothetical protein NDU88_006169 [Pleurodeles waltl]|uniref:Uncharacterized protein n=1 Tax=Pleurodeles waltl TaxID=8319 RepID=A0AAV7NR13_PLEWA|nr:hypothetical protein NDU88_006169 [Pleurodeles waltl]